MAPPNSQKNVSTPATDPPFVITLRARTAPSVGARTFTGKRPVDALKRAMHAKNIPGDALMTWLDGHDGLVALDIDPPSDARLPDDYDVAALFPSHLPRPLAAWRTHGGGVRGLFAAVQLVLRNGELIAEVSALEAAAGWLFLAPLGGLGRSAIEVKRDTRHPSSSRPEGGVCGPVTWFGEQRCVIAIRGSVTADVSASAITEWCVAEGLRFGRYATSECPIPACALTRKTSGNPPIEVNDAGMHCYRCRRHVQWSELLHGAGRHELADAAEHFVHLEHQIHVLRTLRPGVTHNELFRGAWRVALLAAHGRELVAERVAAGNEEERDDDDEPRIAARVALAATRGVNMIARAVGGSWLQSRTLAARTTLTARTARGLPWVQRQEQIDESLDTVALAGFTPLHVINATAVLPPYFTPPERSVLARRSTTSTIQTPADVSRPPSPDELAHARRVLDRRFPGLHHAYLDSLIVAGLHAQHARGQPPFLVVTGRTGAAKTATIEIAAAALGTSTASVKLDESRVTGRDIGLALEHGAGFVLIDEIGRARDPFQRLDAVLKLGATIRFDAKFRNEVTRPMNAAIVLAGSSIPHALSRSPEMARRALGLRLVQKAPGWHREHLSRVREDDELRVALDAITAHLWHALAAEGPRGHWRDVCLRIGASELFDLELDDVSSEARAAIIRTTFEFWRTAPAIVFYAGSGHDRDWLDLEKAERIRTTLEEIIDLGEHANSAVQHAQLEDLRKIDLAPILGFDTPVLELVVRRRSARLLLKFVQRGVQKGKEVARRDLPEIPLEGGPVVHSVPMTRLRAAVTPYATTPGEVSEPPVTALVAEAPTLRDLAVAFDVERIAPGVERVIGASLVSNLGETTWRPGIPVPDVVAAAASGGVPIIVRDWLGGGRRAWVGAGWPTPTNLMDLSRLERATGARVASVRAAMRSGGDSIAEARALHLAPRSWPLHPSERAVLDADRAINERGFLIDRDLARALHDVAAIVRADLATVAAAPLALLQKPSAFLRVLVRAGGPALPDVQRTTLEAALEDERLPYRAARLIEARIGIAASTISRARAALHHVDSDGRLRDTLVYAGAHPGRWSAKGYPAHNQPRAGARVTDVTTATLARDLPALVEIAKAEDRSISALLGGIVRNIIVAPDDQELVIADYSSFEPRVLRWTIGDDAGLADYREPDPYRSRAAVMFGHADVASVPDEDRELAKLSEIACAYGMGGAKLDTYGSARGLDWSAMPMDAYALVDLWRRQNPQVLLLWERLERALDAASRGVRHHDRLGRLRLGVREGEKTLTITLPSGRALRYVDVQRYERDGRVSYEADARGRRAVYGGSITQNISEAVTRDILASVLVRAEAAQLRVVLHVHDEIVVEGDEEDALLLVEIMTTPPSWAPDLPLAVKVMRRRRYGG